MADLSKTIEIIFSGRNETGKAIASIESQISSFNSIVGSAAGTLSGIATNVLLFESAIGGLALALGGKAYSEAVKFESSLADLQKQLDSNEGSAEDVSDAIEGLALKYGKNANELVRATADFKAAGFDLDTSLGLVEQSLKLVIAGAGDAEFATEKLNAALSGFKVPAGEVITEAAHMGDVLNKAADISASSFPELLQGFSDLAPLARLAGLSVEETAALLSTVTDVFGSGAEAARALGSGFQSLADPSREARLALEAIGVSVTDASGKLRPIRDIIYDVAGAFTSLDTQTKIATASIIFGKDQAAKMATVFDDWNKVTERTTILLQEAGGSIDKEVNIRLQLAETQIGRTNEAWRQFLEALGKEIKVETTGVIKGVGEIALALERVVESGGLDPLLKIIEPQLTSLADLLSNVAKNLPAAFERIDWSNLERSMVGFGDAVTEAFEALFGTRYDLNTLDGLTAAIQKVVDIGAKLIDFASGYVSASTPFLSAIGALTSTASDADNSLYRLAGAIGSLSGQVSAVLPFLDTLLLGLLALGKQNVIAGLTSVIGLLGTAGLAAAAGAAGAGIGTLANEGISALITKLTGSSATLGTWIFDITHAGEAASQAAGQTLPLGQALEKLNPKLDDSAAAIKDFDGNVANFVGKANLDKLGLSAGTLKNQWESLGFVFDETTGDVLTAEEALARQNAQVQNSTDTARGYHVVMKDGVATYEQYGASTTKATDASFKLAKALKDNVATSLSEVSNKALSADKDIAKLQVELEKIASNERIKNIELKSKVDVAQIESDTQRVKAAFESVNVAIQSTGSTLSDLTGQFASAKSEWDKSIIRDLVEKEEKRRQQAFEQQKKLLDAQIEYMRERTAALSREDAIIKVSAEGLEPALENLLWEFLKKIQIRASRSGQDFLLGLPA